MACVNENAGILHHFQLSNDRPTSPRSFLLDGGLEFNGYPSDITRTYSFDKSNDFFDLIDAMDHLQLSVVREVRAGLSYVELHHKSQLKIAELLVEFEFITAGIEPAMEQGLPALLCRTE